MKDIKKKNYFTISQISEMYHIGLDSLRYYEKIGILTPKRNPENNYRIYGLEEVRRLNIISELRKLNVPFPQIARYLSERSTEATVNLLQSEDKRLQQTIRQLTAYRSNIQRCLNTINGYLISPMKTEPELKYLPERPCISLVREDISDAEADYALNEISNMTHNTIPIIGNSDCYLMTFQTENPMESPLSTKKVLFMTDAENEYTNDLIPGGYYINVTLYGNHNNFYDCFPMIENAAQENHCSLTGTYLELYHVDTYETDNMEEYVKELQFEVKY